MTAKATPVSVTPWQVVQWLLKHEADAPKIAADAQAILAAPDLTTRWTATKALGDVIVPDLADFPTSGTLSAADQTANEKKLQALDGWNVNPANFQALLAFLAQLLQILIPKPAGG